MNDYTPAADATPVADVAKLQEDIAILNNLLGFAQAAVVSWDNRFKGIKAALQEFADDETITEDTMLGDYLIEEFDLELTKEVEVEITVKYTATMTIPKNADASDFGGDLEISDVELNSDNAEMTGVSCDDYEIREL